jgi:hypothetical protein
VNADESAPIVAALRKRPEAWVDFMMRFELGIEKPDPRRYRGTYTAGTLFRYIQGEIRAHTLCCCDGRRAPDVRIRERKFYWSAAIAERTLHPLIGGLAAGAAFIVARAIM